MAVKVWKGTGTPGAAGVVVIVQDSTGLLFDANDGTFNGSPVTPYATPIESLVTPGVYTISIAAPWADDSYRFHWYESAALTSAPVVTALTLVSDDEPAATTSLVPQEVRDAMLLAPTPGAAAAGSIDALIGTPDVDLATDIAAIGAGGASAVEVADELAARHGKGTWTK
jgi:hypothetical protein